MDDPIAIAARYGVVAHQIVNDATKIVDDAYGKINKLDPNNKSDDQGPYTAGDAISSMSRLFMVAAKGAIDLARIPLQIQPDQGPMLLADHIATVAGTAVSDAEKVVENLTKSVDANDFPANQKSNLVQTAVQLTTIGMLRGAEVLESVAAGPGRYRNPMITSDPLPIEAVSRDRELRVRSMGRAAVPGENIAKLVEIIPKDRILRDGESSFQLRVNAAGIPSGVFVGVVQPYVPGTQQKDGDALKVSLAL